MKLKICLILTILVLLSLAQIAKADARLDYGINFLHSKQDSSGKITSGFSAPSQWTAIALAALGIDVATFKTATSSASLKDFLLTDTPVNNSATDWESRILTIVAINENPASFGGTNYLQNLEGFYNNGQLGDLCALNDDIFGLLALIAGGGLANSNIKQHILDFIISKQDLANGGFGWSAPGCAWYDTASDMTAAAIQALHAAKDNGLINKDLDNAISRAKAYLLTTQSTDGGFGYFGSSDADTTGWVLMALNVLGMKDSTQAINAKNWLAGKQQSDGGFPGWNGSDSTTTAQGLIALSGTGWILKIFTPTATPNATPSATPAPVPTPTPSPTPTPTPSPTPSATPTSTPSPSPVPTLSPTPTSSPTSSPTPSPTPFPEVLGTTTEVIDHKDVPFSFKKIFFSFFSLANFIAASIYWKVKM